MTGVRALSVAGTAYEQGFQQGQAAVDGIAANLVQIQKLIDSFGVEPDVYHGYVERAAGHLRRVDPTTIEEVQGIADGSGIDYRDILSMNVPVFVIMRRSKIVDECSIFAVSGESTSDGKTYLVKTRDQPVDQFNYEHVVLKRGYADGTSIIEVNAAGIVTNPGNGMNSAGLAVGTAGVWSKQRMGVRMSEIENSWTMPDVHYMLRNASTVEEAREVFRSWPRLVGMNLLVADTQGAMGTIELTATDEVWTPGSVGTCELTNHYVSDSLSELSATPEEYPSTHARLRCITDTLAEKRGSIGFDDIVALMTDTSDGPQNSVWRVSPDGKGSVTTYGSIVCLDDFRVVTQSEDLNKEPVVVA